MGCRLTAAWCQWVRSKNVYEALISQDGFEQGSAFYFRQGSDNKYLDWGGGGIPSQARWATSAALRESRDGREKLSLCPDTPVLDKNKQRASFDPWPLFVNSDLYDRCPESRIQTYMYKSCWNLEPFRRLMQTSVVDWGEKKSHFFTALPSRLKAVFPPSGLLWSVRCCNVMLSGAWVPRGDASVFPSLGTAMGLVSLARGWDSMWRRTLRL